MNYLYEIVQYDKNIPGRILMQDKPGWRCGTMPHWHSELELVYMISGSLKVTRNGEVRAIHSGEFYFCNSRVIHSTAVPDNQSNYRYIVVLISYDFLLRFHDDCVFDIPSGEAYEKLKTQLEYLVKIETNPSEVLGRRGNADIEKNKAFLEICQILISDCISKPSGCSFETKGKIGYAKAVMKYVQQNYARPLTLLEIANEIGLSPQYLSRYFRKVTGLSLLYYINLIRLGYANENLLNDDVTVVEAALNNGFANAKAYVRLCKDVYGITPTEYRKAVRGVCRNS